jgi:Flp pilus assembly protein TadB
MNNYHKLMEKFWLIVALASALYAFYSWGKFGIERTGIMLVLPVIALILFALRYFTRKRLEKKFNQDQE